MDLDNLIEEFKVYVITKGDVLRFFVIEIMIGTMTYSIAIDK